MAVVERFHIEGSFTITGRGLMAIGDLIEGKVKVGDYLILSVNGQRVTFKVGAVGTGRSVGRETDYVGITFVFRDNAEKARLESVRLVEQDADIVDRADEGS
jgi:hypothetical protein